MDKLTILFNTANLGKTIISVIPCFFYVALPIISSITNIDVMAYNKVNYTFSGNMQNNRIYNLQNPVSEQDAVTKFYVDTEIFNSQFDRNMAHKRLFNLANPLKLSDAVTKYYVDFRLSNFKIPEPVSINLTDIEIDVVTLFSTINAIKSNFSNIEYEQQLINTNLSILGTEQANLRNNLSNTVNKTYVDSKSMNLTNIKKTNATTLVAGNYTKVMDVHLGNSRNYIVTINGRLSDTDYPITNIGIGLSDSLVDNNIFWQLAYKKTTFSVTGMYSGNKNLLVYWGGSNDTTLSNVEVIVH